MGSNTSGGVKLLGTSGLTSADRHGGSVQVVSSTNGDLTTDDPATGHSNTPITGPVELDAVSETKYDEVDAFVDLFSNVLFSL